MHSCLFVCLAASFLLSWEKCETAEFLTMDVLRKKTLLQMAAKSFMLSWRRFCRERTTDHHTATEVHGKQTMSLLNLSLHEQNIIWLGEPEQAVPSCFDWVSDGVQAVPWRGLPPGSCRIRWATPRTAPPWRPRNSQSTSSAQFSGLQHRTSYTEGDGENRDAWVFLAWHIWCHKRARNCTAAKFFIHSLGAPAHYLAAY